MRNPREGTSTGKPMGIFSPRQFAQCQAAAARCTSPDAYGVIAMTKRLRIALALVLAAVLGGVAWRALRQPEPVYQGKPLSFWLKGFQLDNQLGKPSLNQAV